MANIKRFILIDDDAESNMLVKFAINKAVSNIEVKIISMPEKALEYIESEYSKMENMIPTIILLEINMATMTGWEFLDTFSKFSQKIKEHFIIYILSSSIDGRDKERALSNPLVSEYLDKPLTMEMTRRMYFLNEGFKKENVHISSGSL